MKDFKQIREKLIEAEDKKLREWGIRFNDDDYVDFIEQIISERDKEWAEHNKKHLNIAINAYDITLPPELIKNLQTLIK